jgi:antitoxin ChpS
MELSIRKLGNSAGIIFPSTLLRSLNLSIGSAIHAEQIEGKIVLTPKVKSRYTLSELLAQCDLSAPVPEDVKAWDLIAPAGKEIF